jgi:hypothetical protein
LFVGAFLTGLVTAVGSAAQLASLEHPRPIAWILFGLLIVVGLVVPAAMLLVESRLRRHDQRALRDEEQGRRLADLRAHFGTRGRGLSPGSRRTGSYFTGRVRVLSEIVAWLADTDPTDLRARLVTGRPGSGKSAVLGRIASFGDRRLRSGADEPDSTDPVARLTAGCVRVCVNAHALGVDAVATIIGDDLGLPVSSASDLLLALGKRSLQDDIVGVVVDGVDEATDPARLMRELLGPIAANADDCRVRLLIGARAGVGRDPRRLLGNRVVVFDLDDAAYRARQDLVDYATALLRADDDRDVRTPYRDDVPVSRTVAQIVADRSAGSFLVAQLICLSLTAASSIVDITRPDWPAALPDSLASAMDRYMGELGADERRVRDLLVPLAFAYGNGLSNADGWARLATVLGTAHYDRTDIAWLLRDARGSYFLRVTTTPDGPAYRLFHEALAEHLRQLSEAWRPADTVHREFVNVLQEATATLAEGPRRDWRVADVYTKTFILKHGEAAHMLPQLLEDLMLVVSVPVDSVYNTILGRNLTGVPKAVQRAVTLHSRALSNDAEAGERASLLQLAARKAGEDVLAERVTRLPLAMPWRVPWARWRTNVEPNRLSSASNHGVRTVRTMRSPEGEHLVCAVASWIWWSRFEFELNFEIADVAVWDDLVYVAGYEGDLAIYHATEGTLVVATKINIDDGDAVELCRAFPIDGTLAVILLSDAGSTWFYDVDSGAVRRQTPHQPFRPLDAGPVLGRTLLVGARNREILVVDLSTYAGQDEPVDPLPNFPDSAAYLDPVWWSARLAELDGRAVAVLGGRAEWPVMVWDIDARATVGKPIEDAGGGTMSVEVIRHQEQVFLFTGTAFGTIGLWRWPDCTAAARFQAHDGGIECVTIVHDDESHVLVTGGRDGSTRDWVIDRLVTMGDQLSQASVGAITTDRQTGRLLVRTSSALQVINPATGTIEVEVEAPQRYSTASVLAHDGVAIIDLEDLVALDGNLVEQYRWPGIVTQDRAMVAVRWEQQAVNAVIWDGDARLTAVDVSTIAGPLPLSDVTVESVESVAVADTEAGPTVLLITIGSHDLLTLASTPNSATASPEVARTTCTSAARQWSITTGVLDGRAVAVVIGGIGHVHVWDVAARTEIFAGQLDDGHSMALNAASVGRIAGHDVIICSGYAGVLTFWRPDGAVAYTIDVALPIWAIEIASETLVLVGGPHGILAIDLQPDVFDQVAGDGHLVLRRSHD